MTGRSGSLWALLASAMLLSGGAWAYDFQPTAAEWAGWPEQCKARFVVTNIGRTSEYVNAIGREVIDLWQARLGECFGMLHHHCAGLVHLERARSAGSQSLRKFELDSAVTEHTFAAGYCPRSNPFWSNIQANLSIVYAEQGNLGKALLTLDEAVSAHPDYDGSYIAKSIVLKREGKTAESRAALIEGSKATAQGSAELEYALGLSYFETKEYEAARRHARIAYKLGYPLPGLMNRLQKAGFPL